MTTTLHSHCIISVYRDHVTSISERGIYHDFLVQKRNRVLYLEAY